MQFSDQSPEEQQPIASSSSSEPEQNLLETPAEEMTQEVSPGFQTAENVPQSATSASADVNATRQDFIYPPPPSFYQQQLVKEEEQWHPRTPPGPEPYAQPQPAPGYPIYQQGGSYPGVQPPPVIPPAPQRPKESRKWIVLLISVLIVVIVASCGLCAWVGSSFFGGIYNQASDLVIGSQTLVDNYYGALQNQQYSQAYSYLHPTGSINGLTQTTYIQRAQQADKQYGPVLRYSSSQPSYTTSGSQITNVSVTVTVARQKKQYTVQLKMQKFNNQWKIIDYNQL